MAVRTEASFHAAASLADASAALRERGKCGQALAGGTWIMRAGLRDEPTARDYVSLAQRRRAAPRGAVGLRSGRRRGSSRMRGSRRRCRATASCEALTLAALKSANPAVRNAATLGGNLCAL